MASGADDYLTKPFSAQGLIQAIEARLRRQGPDAAALSRTKVLQHQLKKILTHRELEVIHSWVVFLCVLDLRQGRGGL